MRARTLVMLGLAATAGLALAPTQAAAAADGAELEVSIDGTPLADASSTDPIVLDPDTPAAVAVALTNVGTEPLEVSTIRLQGTVAGLRLFAYETQLGLRVEPGTDEVRTFELDLAALEGQAVGLLPAEVQLLDADRGIVASESAVVDVHGSIASVYGLWGLVVAAIAAFQLLQLWLALARHRLPANRWRRGIRFASLGVTVGILIVFALSALRIVAPHSMIWLPVVGGLTIAMFLLGYLAPFFDGDDEEIGDWGQDLPGLNDRFVDGPYANGDRAVSDPRTTNEIPLRLDEGGAISTIDRQ